MVIPTGVIRPPPIPCSTRNATSSPKPLASPHRADAAVKTAMAPSRTCRGPSRSPSQAAAGMESATATW